MMMVCVKAGGDIKARSVHKNRAEITQYTVTFICEANSINVQLLILLLCFA